MKAEAAHRAKNGGPSEQPDEEIPSERREKHLLEENKEDAEDLAAKRRRILEETRDVDADSDESGDNGSSSEERYV